MWPIFMYTCRYILLYLHSINAGYKHLILVYSLTILFETILYTIIMLKSAKHEPTANFLIMSKYHVNTHVTFHNYCELLWWNENWNKENNNFTLCMRRFVQKIDGNHLFICFDWLCHAVVYYFVTMLLAT